LIKPLSERWVVAHAAPTSSERLVPPSDRFTTFYNPLRWLDTLDLTGLYSLKRLRSEGTCRRGLECPRSGD